MDAKGGGILMCKLKGQMDNRGWALCGNERVDAKGSNMVCKLQGRMDKGEHYDVEMKRWMQRVAL